MLLARVFMLIFLSLLYRVETKKKSEKKRKKTQLLLVFYSLYTASFIQMSQD
jgi:hypothetical protein